jgi:hypothetical protein
LRVDGHDAGELLGRRQIEHQGAAHRQTYGDHAIGTRAQPIQAGERLRAPVGITVR